jgi:hypothetical protein
MPAASGAGKYLNQIEEDVMSRVLLMFLTLMLFITSGAYAQSCADVNGDGHVNLSDISYMWSEHLGGATIPAGKGDIDYRQGYNAGDLRFLIEYLHGGGPVPGCPPFPSYSLVNTNDSLILPTYVIPAGSGEFVLPIYLINHADVSDIVLPLQVRGLCGTVFFDSLHNEISSGSEAIYGKRVDGSTGVFMFSSTAAGHANDIVSGNNLIASAYFHYTSGYGGTVSMDTVTIRPHTFLNYVYGPSHEVGIPIVVAKAPDTYNCPANSELNACQAYNGGVPYQFTVPEVPCVPPPTWSLVAPVPAGAAITADGAFTYNPPTDPASLGPQVMTVRATDEFGASDDCVFTVTVVNDAPVITSCPESFSLNACFTYSIAFAFEDPNVCVTPVWTLIPPVPNGAIITTDGILVYDPPTDVAELGPHVFTAQVTDEFGASNDCVFTVTVVNDTPVITNCPGPSNLDACGIYTLQFTADDPNICLPNTLVWSLVAPVPDGATITAGGLLTFAPLPVPAALGPKVITVKVVDQFGAFALCTFTITVVNDAPVFTNCPTAAIDLFGCTTATYEPIATDQNKCTALVFSLVAPVPAGATIVPATGVVTYDPPDATPSGLVPVTVQVTDGFGAFTQCVANFNVKADAPVFTVCPNPDADIPVMWGHPLSGYVTAVDPDAGPVALVYTLLPGLAGFNGPTTAGAFHVDPGTGAWSWPTEYGNNAYSGEFAVSIQAFDGCKADTCNFTVHVVGMLATIGKLHKVIQGHYAFDSVFVAADGNLLGGLDLLIGYDASALALSEVLPGTELAQWEYFTYRFGAQGNCNGSCPSGLVRIVAIADMNNGYNHPPTIAYTIGDNNHGLVAILKFLVTDDRTYECQFVPIGFFWLACTDNVLSSPNGQIAYLSHYVWWYTGDFPPADVIRIDSVTDATVDAGYHGWGGILGHPICDSLDGQKIMPLSAVDFYDGGIDIACADSIDARGDINLNGIANEIADAVIFTQYFLIGIDAFPEHPEIPNSNTREAAIAASDVNADGKPLSIGDLVYLLRIIVGDAQPYAKSAPYSSNADISVFGDKISIESSETIGAMYLTFNVTGDNFTVVNNTNMEVLSNRVGNKLNVLVYSGMTNKSNAIPAGTNELLTVTGAQLNSVEAADYYGNLLNTRVAKSALPTQFSLSQNIPNPFNPSTKIGLDLPSFTGWQIDIYNVNGQLVQSYNGTNIGHVEVTWDASNAASGIYFYKVTAGSFTDTKKMVLMK